MAEAHKERPTIIRALKGGRLDMRLDERQKRLIEQGAALRGLSVSDFVVQSAAAAAEQAIRSQAVIELTLEGQQAFVQALENPPAPNQALRDAFRRRTEMLGGE